MKSTWSSISAAQVIKDGGGAVDPRLFPDEQFELFSIPAHDSGQSEMLSGMQIGSTKQIVADGDVLLSKIVPHIRRAWVVQGRSDARKIGSGEWIVFRSPLFCPSFLRYLLLGDSFHRQFMQTVSGVGGSLLRARPAFVKQIQLPLPPLDEQRRIAAILDKADALRDKRRQALAQVEQLTQSVFLEMFGDPVSQTGFEAAPLLSICKATSGGTPSRGESSYWDGAVPWYSPKDLKSDIVYDSAEHLSERGLAKSHLKLFPKGTVVIVVRGMILAHTFPVCQLGQEGAINQDVKALVPGQNVTSDFLAATLRASSSHVLNLVSTAGHGTKKLDAFGLSQIQIPLPPVELQQEFARRVEVIERLKDAHRRSLEELDALFASLQHRAFRGEL